MALGAMAPVDDEHYIQVYDECRPGSKARAWM
jgi:hypothetical protein